MKKYIYLFLSMGCLLGNFAHANVKTGNAEIDKSINNRFGTCVKPSFFG